MNYIVFDLEWNQNPDGRKHPDSRLPFEIIEIGAVKLNEKREIIDTFQCLIKPKVYLSLKKKFLLLKFLIIIMSLKKEFPFHERSADFWTGVERSTVFLPGGIRM